LSPADDGGAKLGVIRRGASPSGAERTRLNEWGALNW
jgi:hypothetical protein